MRYIKTYKESLTQDRLDYLLDKIGDKGIESLSSKEQQELNTFNKTAKSDVSVDNDGDLVVSGEKLNKREKISEWSHSLEDEIVEYLFNNFTRTLDGVKDNLDLDIELDNVISRVEKFFNCILPEINKVVSKWYNGLLTENLDNKLDSKILLMSKELVRVISDYYTREDYNELFDGENQPTYTNEITQLFDVNEELITPEDINEDIISKLTNE